MRERGSAGREGARAGGAGGAGAGAEPRALLLRGEFAAARDAAEAALERDPSDPEALDVLGEALWTVGDRDGGIARRQEAYAAHRRRGDRRRAAWLATYLAGEARIDGRAAEANGWLGRARRLLDELETGSEHGWLAIEEAKRAGTPEEAAACAERALAIARAADDVDVEISALAQLGLAKTTLGDVDGGMALLDEAMAAALGGEPTEWLCIGDACCTTLVACDRLSDLPRAVEWCRLVVEWAERRRYLPIQSWCRSIYAGVLTRTGDWPAAEAALEAALARPHRVDKGGRAVPLARLAELRVRQGRLEEAEELLAEIEDHPAALEPAVELRLRRGEVAVAEALVERRLRALGDAAPVAAPHRDPAAGAPPGASPPHGDATAGAPSGAFPPHGDAAAGAPSGASPPRFDPAAVAAVLPLQVAVRVAAGDLDGAAAAAERLAELARQLARPDLVAQSELGAAKVAIARGDGTAVTHLEVAAERFGALGMPFDEGRARLLLARCHASGGSPLAVGQARAACRIFERLGARGDADEAAALLRELGGGGRSGPRGDRDALTAREREVLDLLAAGLSNPEIAERLVISRRTAEHHVASVLSKLGLKSRAQAAAFVAREG
ncbi:MAG TPA: LuxR C-terminal-related transcriptional regulator [Solirubrobacteraceae bacterium]